MNKTHNTPFSLNTVILSISSKDNLSQARETLPVSR